MRYRKTTVRSLCHLNTTWCPARLHAAGGVDRIAPHVIRESVTADHGCHCRAAIDTDAKADTPSVLLVQLADPVQHVKSHVGDGLGMVGPGHRQSADDEIRVARDANGPQTVLLSQPIEGGQELIENGDGDIRRLRGRPLRESHHVSEKDADVLKSIGDRVLLALEALSDLGWKHDEEHPLGSLHGLIPLDPKVGQEEGDEASNPAQIEDEKRSLSTVRQGWN